MRKAAKAAPFTDGNRAAAGGHNFSRSEKRQQLLDDPFVLAFTAERKEVQVSAAIVWLDRFEGCPVAMAGQASAPDPSALDDAELEHELRLHAVQIRAKRKTN